MIEKKRFANTLSTNLRYDVESSFSIHFWFLLNLFNKIWQSTINIARGLDSNWRPLVLETTTVPQLLPTVGAMSTCLLYFLKLNRKKVLAYNLKNYPSWLAWKEGSYKNFTLPDQSRSKFWRWCGPERRKGKHHFILFSHDD